MTQFDKTRIPDVEEEERFCEGFLKAFGHSQKYVNVLQEISNRTRNVIDIELDDIIEYAQNDDFAHRIELHALRYIAIFCDVIDSLLPKPTIDIKNTTRADVYMSSRERMNSLHRDVVDDDRNKIPKELSRRYEIRLIPRSDVKPLTVRTITSEHIGRLTTMTGMVTRITSVKPLLLIGTYTCDGCGFEFFQPIRSKEFMPMVTCENDKCTSSDKIHMQTRGSKFLKYQQITIQESPDQVPVGGIPRSMIVNLRSSSVRQCTAGDRLSVTGIFLPIQLTGFRGMKSGLTSGTIFEAMKIHKTKKGYSPEEQDKELLDEVKEMSQDPDCYNKLSQSIAPEIFGHEDVKKSLLLLMMSGVTKKLNDGMTIRGDINILLMGDPGVAKSQLLKHISTIAPRAVYTTGKGSSGVGLTAAVMRDPVTNEMVLEGGALILADMGICCIDEFDKMEEADRTAIHEVMEQQSVSIAKAGICTTLNARTAILAAANPAFGRYDKKKSPEANIVLPAALMSRFDLLFVMVDTPDRDFDVQLARHICFVHKNLNPPELDFETVSPNFIRAYISHARQFEPTIPRHLTQNVVGTYISLRTEGRDNDAKRLLATPRTLLSILRLAQALARLRFSNEIIVEDLEEATRLMHASKESMRSDEDEGRFLQDTMTRIFSHIKDFMQIRSLEFIKLVEIMDTLKVKGFSIDMINKTLEHYQDLDIWMIDSAKTKLTLVDV